MLIRDFALDGLAPERVERPESVAKVSALLAEAHLRGLAVVPWGGGTHQHLGNRLERYDMALSTAALAGVREYAPGDLTVTVGAGTPLADVQAVLAEHGQWLPLEAETPGRATVGGLVSAAVAGPLRARYGTARERLLWVEAVRADGTLVHGGAKVVKNVAGYDVPKLFWGALGTAGVLTALTLRVEPLPERRWTLEVPVYSVEALRELHPELASLRLAPSLYELTFSPPRPRALDAGGWTLWIGVDGDAETTAWQLAQLEALVLRAGLEVAVRTDEPEARERLTSWRNEGAVLLKASVLPSLVPEVLELCEPLGASHVGAEAANGVIRWSWAAPSEQWREVAELVAALGGTWVLERCPLAWKQAPLDVWGPARGDRPLMHQLRAALDPRGVLNPGRFAGG